VSIAEIVSAIREERLQDAVRLLLARECVVTVYARRVLRVELQGRVQLLAPWEPAASLTHKLHALFGIPAPAEPCRECPDRGFPS
jgi:cation transport regulator ChaC